MDRHKDNGTVLAGGQGEAIREWKKRNDYRAGGAQEFSRHIRAWVTSHVWPPSSLQMVEAMVFVDEVLTAAVLVALTIVLQSAGMAALIEWAKAHLPSRLQRPGHIHSAVLMVRLAGLIFFLHLLEILLWSWFYRLNCFATWESSFYFSAVSYSTVGYGDIVLQGKWRLLGPLESLTGVLMCALSASFLFAVVTRLVQHDEELESS
jgi:hypothetical protein